MTVTDEKPLTAREMCARYQISRSTLTRWIDQGLPHYRTPGSGNNTRLHFYPSEVDNWRRPKEAA